MRKLRLRATGLNFWRFFKTSLYDLFSGLSQFLDQIFEDPPTAVLVCWSIGSVFFLVTFILSVSRILKLRKAAKTLALPRMYIAIMMGPIVYAASALFSL